jgi:energy-coupling factor transporter ATP-binding protein EcfA2
MLWHMDNRIHITSVSFSGYKAFSNFRLRLSHMNVLVGPNNCGKSTILGAFRVLAHGIRHAKSKRAESIVGPERRRPGWRLSDDALPIAYENIHTDYEEIDTIIEFNTSNRGKFTLFFPRNGGCIFFADHEGSYVSRPGELNRWMPVTVQIVPVLGPVEHQEQLVTEDTIRRNLATTRASRNFRNYWLQYPDGFDEFAELVRRTWPGMDIERPERLGDVVGMFCLENRISRELYWAGFGFQVWLQLLTHIFRSGNSSLIVVDEPEIYLHPDIQRQMLGILRDCGPDVLLATHSTEIMSEADPSEILLIDKGKRTAERLKDVEGVQAALDAIGSVQNITLTRLARNKRLLFVEGESDFRLIRRFARKLGMAELASGTDLTALESGGFSSWERIRALAGGFENALGVALHVGAIFDRDYWCDEEIASIEAELARHLEFSRIHHRKEIENYLLIPSVLERALDAAMRERARRVGDVRERNHAIGELLDLVTRPLRFGLQSQYIAKRIEYHRRSPEDVATITSEAMRLFESKWNNIDERMTVVPGKAVLASLRAELSSLYAVNLTDHRIVSEFTNEEIPNDLILLLEELNRYREGLQ